MALKMKWSSASEGLSSRMAKDLAKFLAAVLTPLFNKSLRDGVFPDMLKFAILVPIFKGGSGTKINNYRPIALLLTIAKIFEKSVKEKNLNYLDHINYFSEKQFGFIRNESADMALFAHN